MMTIGCKELGLACDFEAQAPTVPELIAIMNEHERETHGTRLVTREQTFRINELARDDGEPWQFE